MPRLFRDCWLNGQQCDLRMNGERIDTIATAKTLSPMPEEEVIEGGLLCPHFAEPHVHLDATQLGQKAPNRSGTLHEGIANWSKLRPHLDPEEILERATETVRWYVAQGTTKIRTHVDTGSPLAAEVLVELRRILAHGVPGLSAEGRPVPVELQIVAFPQEGLLRAEGQIEQWQSVVKNGVDAVGAIPHFEKDENDGARSLRMAMALASEHDLRVDVHCDETDDPTSKFLEVLCKETMAYQMQGRVVAGHCTAMHGYSEQDASKVIEQVMASDVLIVTNPLDNVVLQGRGPYPRIRGLTRVDQLWEAGASVGIGHDSVVDPWYRLGTASMLDPAYMAIHLGHLTSEAQIHRTLGSLTRDNHLPFGDIPRIEPGEQANLLWFDANDPVDLFRARPLPLVWHRGRRLSRDPALLRAIGRGSRNL